MNYEVKKIKSDGNDTVESCTSIDKCSPRKLSTLCICYVAGNLDLVESLLYFPDVMGVEIFNEALKLREFQGRDKECLMKLKLFCEAYENLMLIRLSLPGSHLCLNNYFEHLSLFEHLEELDVSSNGLGDDHDVLHHISHLKWLRTLCLRNNCLSNEGLRKLTSPIRMLHQGPLDLHNLDLTENPEISSKGVKYLKCFQNLQVLILSPYTSTQGNMEDIIPGMVVMTTDCDIDSKFIFETEGWAKDVIETWKLTALIPPRPSGKYKRNFYKFSKERSESEINNNQAQRKQEKVLTLIRNCNNEKNTNYLPYKESHSVVRHSNRDKSENTKDNKDSSGNYLPCIKDSKFGDLENGTIGHETRNDNKDHHMQHSTHQDSESRITGRETNTISDDDTMIKMYGQKEEVKTKSVSLLSAMDDW